MMSNSIWWRDSARAPQDAVKLLRYMTNVLGKSPAEISSILMVSEETLENWINGKEKPGMFATDDILSLAAKLKIDVKLVVNSQEDSS